MSDNGDVAYKAALFNDKCYYAKRGNGGFEDRHIVMAQNLRISELPYDDIVGNSQEANSPSMLKMLQNFTNATFHWASAGFKIADDETLAKLRYMPILEGFRPPWNGEMPKVRLHVFKA